MFIRAIRVYNGNMVLQLSADGLAQRERGRTGLGHEWICARALM